MHINDIFTQRKTTVSFEFFPPKTDKGASALFEEISQLAPLKPSFVSATYGAGGGTRELTRELVIRIKNETPIEVIPHLTCVTHTEAEIYDILETYAQAGISNILALGGDVPQSLGAYDRSKDAFRFASQLVRYIRQFKDRHGGEPIGDNRGFGIGVAGFPEGHPGTPNRLEEIDHLKAKVDEGADFIITQLFFDNRDFVDFCERCELAGIKVPIIAGIMPITSINGMRKMAELAAGARIPARLLRAVERCQGDAEAVTRVGVHWATEQCRDLLDQGVRGIHLYTLNKSSATRDIYSMLGIKDSLVVA
ncbi:MAG: methylenetetrahydrofolate reductase [NAD(P)H] [Phycisphaerales bacterium]